MKKIFLCAVMAFSVMAASVNTYAYGLKIEDGEIELIEDVDYADENQYDNVTVEIDDSPSVIDLDDDWEPDESDFKEYYYDQLNDMQKYVYDYVNENADYLLQHRNSISIPLPESLYVNYDETYVNMVANAARICLNYDHAENFGYDFSTIWLGKIGDDYVDDNGETAFQVKKWYMEIGKERGIYGYDTSDVIMEDHIKIESNIDNILASIPQNASRYKKLQIINDWLVDNNTYNSYVYDGDRESASKIAWMSSSALLYGNGEEIEKYPVCEGYAEAFKYLCDKVNIPCVSVSSSSHKWNKVQMEDDKWYTVDVTWNDPTTSSSTVTNRYRYRYFLIGDTSLKSKDSSTAHTIKMYDKYNVNTPETSDTDYVYAHNGDVNGDYLIDNEDAAIMLKYISGTRNLTDEEITLGDVDNDGDITLKDVVSALKTMQ